MIWPRTEEPSKPWYYQLMFLGIAIAWLSTLTLAFDDNLGLVQRWGIAILCVGALSLWVIDHND